MSVRLMVLPAAEPGKIRFCTQATVHERTVKRTRRGRERLCDDARGKRRIAAYRRCDTFVRPAERHFKLLRAHSHFGFGEPLHGPINSRLVGCRPRNPTPDCVGELLKIVYDRCIAEHSGNQSLGVRFSGCIGSK